MLLLIINSDFLFDLVFVGDNFLVCEFIYLMLLMGNVMVILVLMFFWFFNVMLFWFSLIKVFIIVKLILWFLCLLFFLVNCLNIFLWKCLLIFFLLLLMIILSILLFCIVVIFIVLSFGVNLIVFWIRFVRIFFKLLLMSEIFFFFLICNFKFCCFCLVNGFSDRMINFMLFDE